MHWKAELQESSSLAILYDSYCGLFVLFISTACEFAGIAMTTIDNDVASVGTSSS